MVPIQNNTISHTDNFFQSVVLLTYSHSSYRDVLNIYFIQLIKYFNQISGYLLIDKLFIDIPTNYKIVYYNNNQSYYQHLIKALCAIKEDYILYMQDDYFLIDEPDFNILNKALIKLKSDKIDFVRLIRTGGETIYFESDIFHKISNNSKTLFSTQATIWKKKSLYNLLSYADKENKIDNIWESEINLNNISIMLDLKGIFLYNNETKRGENHWDSKYFPYTATAIVKGKWNYKEYKDELINIFSSNKINTKRQSNINSKILNLIYFFQLSYKKIFNNN